MNLADTLSPEHLAELTEGSAITPETISARGYRTLYGDDADRARLASLGFRPSLTDREETYPALLVPVMGADGEPRTHQVKPRVPVTSPSKGGKVSTRKYVSPPRVPIAVDLPAATLRALDEHAGTALWITEGMKKVDALVSKGCAAVGMTGVWNWRSRHGALGDWEDVPIKGRPVVVCFDADAADNRHVQQAMTRLGAWLKSRGAAKVHYLIVPPQVDGVPVKGVDDFFAAGGALEDLRAAASDRPPADDVMDGSFSDAFLVEELVTEALEADFCWSSGLGWMRWDGRVWREITEVDVIEAARVWASERFDAALSKQGTDAGKDRSKEIGGWRAVLGNSRLRALVSLSKGLVQVESEEFDSDPDLFTVLNGTLHLPTGKLLPFDPSHRITRLAGARYDPCARHPKWLKALEAVPEDVQGWLQERMGQALTGYKTPDHRMIIGQGGGSNGKSTVANIFRTVMGKYGVLISERVLMANPDAHPTELMDLRGARYAVIEETPEARHLNVQRLKATLGTDSITARRIRQDPVEFLVTHSLFINTNYRPVVTETDHGTWRRLALMPYPYTFRAPGKPLTGPLDRVGDPAMEYAHHDPAVRSAALLWMLQGAMRWYANDRMMSPLPERIETATAEWRAETDLIMGFASEMLRFEDEAFTSSADMLKAFNEWIEERNHRPWNDKTFASRFSGHDMIQAAKVELRRKYVEGRQVRGWVGASVRRPGDDGGDPFGDVEPPAPQPVYVTEPGSDDPEYLPEHPANAAPVAVGFDIETADAGELFMGRHDGPFVRLCGLVEDSQPDGVTGPSAESLIESLNDADVIYGHGVFRFDLLALARHCGADYDALAAKTIDTMELGYLLDPPGAKREGTLPMDLDSVAKRLGHTGKSDDLKRLADKWGGFDKIPVDDPEYSDYLRGDLDATRYVYENQVHSETTEPYWRREMRVMALLGRMTLNGWAIDTELLAERVKGEDDRRAAAVQTLHTEFGMPLAKPDRFKVVGAWRSASGGRSYKVVSRYVKLFPEAAVRRGLATRIPGEPLKSPWSSKEGRPALVKAFADAGAPHYPKTKTGELALSSDALGEGDWFDKSAGKARPGMLKVYGHIPAVRRLVETLGEATGATAKYAEIQRWTTPEGRVHARTGAPQASGRWATTQFASANLGKRGDKVEQRRVMIAEPGHVLITCDLSQVDVRAVAAHSQDPVLIEMLQPGRDYHSDMAELFSGDRGKRKEYKPVSHGLNYNQSARAIAEQHGLDLGDVQRAAGAHAEKLHVLAEAKLEWIERARSGALLDNGFGRLMRCDPDRAWTQAPALMGQGAARDIMTESLLRFVEFGEGTPGFEHVRDTLRGIVHDELVISVPEGEAEHWRTLLGDAFTWEWRGVPILCDVSRPGRNWAECAED